MKLRKLCKLFSVIGLIVVLSTFFCVPALAYEEDIFSGGSYTYDEFGASVLMPNAYEYFATYQLDNPSGIDAKNVSDMFISKNNNIYITDTYNSRVLVYDKNFKFIKEVSQITEPDGKVSNLSCPQGIFVYEDETLLIADTQNNRIVKCDIDGNASLIITKSEKMTGVNKLTTFNPLKLIADSVGRIYVVAKDINFGFVQLDSDGKFMGYVGAPRVQTDFFTLFWRRFSTKKQLQKLNQFVSTEYNNIFIDENDFIYGTISTLSADAIKSTIESRDLSGSVAPLKKINSLGNDILVRNGTHAPLGDLDFQSAPSRIVDVALGKGGTYTILDQTKSHIFTYDSQGNLLFAFGNKGYQKSAMQNPVSIGYMGEDIYVLDADLNIVQHFKPTDYGKLLLEAVTQTYNGNYTEAYEIWADVSGKNSNFKYAFEGLGNTELNNGKYDDAMMYFKAANSIDDYSVAFGLKRKDIIEKYFPTFFFVCVIVVAVYLLYLIIKKIYNYGRGKNVK